MNKKVNWLHSFVTFVFFTASFTATAADINQIDTNTQEQIRQQERLRQLRQQQELKPDARDAGEQLKQSTPVVTNAIPDNEMPCFMMTNIVLVGDSADKFQFALNEVLSSKPTSQADIQTKPILGRCLGVVGINAVMARVQNAIIAKGFVTTRVVVAQ
jgi:hemolysin activation/secretion protein